MASGRLSLTDTVRVGASGLLARPLRSVLSALGIAIGTGGSCGGKSGRIVAIVGGDEPDQG